MEVTRVSRITGVTHTLDLPITEEQMRAYERGALIQQAMPDLAPGLREFIATGITPQEWDQFVGAED
ncbi:hypothetical protein H7J07_04895 [Mycobacterium koreense]|uniref:Uncharacterized protein n=1 Tax=Mycolicibacillus koreensis TaxID=1069220 RepID=A0A7I7SB76_9MYCO|nr:hypothetical protein [Mycolicibacillus koreensis]MCV7247595.1 hypothetical protein [Mycolicibacillus koreensis]OSC32829.1 hypothetical protein B8W67_14005 [Mycolicibacillus koreensis]BBY53973.1 hypothetical protein MKOR_12240 [Mycolicibacillus koreensis]